MFPIPPRNKGQWLLDTVVQGKLLYLLAVVPPLAMSSWCMKSHGTEARTGAHSASVSQERQSGFAQYPGHALTPEPSDMYARS